MSEVWTPASLAASVAGFLLGVFFFGGLWWTIRKGVASGQPAVWFVGSLLLRVSVTLAGFYLVAVGHPDRLLLCLVGFVMARLAVTRLTRTPGERGTSPAQEASHAP
jgi:F1F0 ATPase subunit 2